MSECIFCKIASGAFNTEFICQDDQALAFKDIHPVAPVHILVIPRAHFETIEDAKDPQLLGHLLQVAQTAAQKMGLTSYRLVVNKGKEAGQEVFHLHLHVLGGRPLHGLG